MFLKVLENYTIVIIKQKGMFVLISYNKGFEIIL
jgi:hypothetical protein